VIGKVIELYLVGVFEEEEVFGLLSEESVVVGVVV